MEALNTFIVRSLDYCRFMARTSMIRQKSSLYWYIALPRSLRDNDIEIDLSADETFVKFHVRTDIALVPNTGTKKLEQH